jgi:hypothetical protein
MLVPSSRAGPGYRNRFRTGETRRRSGRVRPARRRKENDPLLRRLETVLQIRHPYGQFHRAGETGIPTMAAAGALGRCRLPPDGRPSYGRVNPFGCPLVITE